jgi:hypothetical protein
VADQVTSGGKSRVSQRPFFLSSSFFHFGAGFLVVGPPGTEHLGRTEG